MSRNVTSNRSLDILFQCFATHLRYIESQRLIYLCWGGNKADLLLQWEGFCFPSPSFSVHPLKKCGKSDCHWRLRKKVVEYISLLLVHSHQFATLVYHRSYPFFDFPFLVDVPIETLLILCVLSQAQLQLCHGSPDPIPTQPGDVPSLLPGHLSLLPFSVYFILAL